MKNLEFSYILALKLSKITFLLKELKMSRLLHFQALDYPIGAFQGDVCDWQRQKIQNFAL